MSTDLRRKALRRANLRTFVQGWLGNDDYRSRFDVEGMVAEMERRDVDTDEMTNTEFWDIATRHEFDDKGVTDAMLAAALERSHSGWVAIIRRSDGDIQQLSVNLGAAEETPESVERRLRDVVRFPEGTVISIFPLVG
jgi:hypothetical protein